MVILYAITASLAVMLLSLIGVITSSEILHDWFTKKLHHLTSFAAGVFLVVVFSLLKESIELVSLGKTAGMAVVGLLLFVVIDRIFPEAHHHHAEDCDKDHSHRNGKRILLADAIHNIADGVVLVSAFLVDLKVGIAVSIGILVHEAIQEVSEFFVLQEAGYTPKQALVRNFAVSGTILVGVGIGAFLSSFSGIVSVLLGLSAGAFLHVVFVDLLPHQLKLCTEPNCYLRHVAWALAGILVMTGIGLLV